MKMRQKITNKELENPERFICEGLGAPEAGEKTLEVKAQKSADWVHFP
jgi:hypothetical protein